MSYLSERRLQTLMLIREYLKWRKEVFGKDSLCFTYKGLEKWFRRNRHWRWIPWSTVWRYIRILCDEHLIERRGTTKSKETIFCISEMALKILEEYESRFHRSGK